MDGKTAAAAKPATRTRCRRILRYAKLSALAIVWLCFTVMLAVFKAKNKPPSNLELEPEDPHDELRTLNIALGGCVLVMLYTLIMFELVHRTVAALIATGMALGLLAWFGEGESMQSIMGMVDVDTLLLLFSMMLYVAVLVPSGLFDYVAVLAFKLTKGKGWPLVNYLGLFTIVMTMFLDNVTAVILMAPVIIRICEVAHLKPEPVLMMVVFSSNLGGIATPLGDPPNVMILEYFEPHGLTFLNFTAHLMVSSVQALLFGYVFMRFIIYRNPDTFRYANAEQERLEHEDAVIKNVNAHMMQAYSEEEEHINELIQKQLTSMSLEMLAETAAKKSAADQNNYEAVLADLQKRYVIRDYMLLWKGGVVMVYLLFMFVTHSVHNFHELPLSWIALTGALLYIILADLADNFEHILHQVEFATLLFFAALFVLMECETKLGLIPWLGRELELMLIGLPAEWRLLVALVSMLWISGVASAFVDNIPVTTMMMQIVHSMVQNKELALPMLPLVLALALGIGLGANGTQIAATTNIVAIGIAEQHGYKITAAKFSKIGMPLMLFLLVVGTGVHVLLYVVVKWH